MRASPTRMECQMPEDSVGLLVLRHQVLNLSGGGGPRCPGDVRGCSAPLHVLLCQPPLSSVCTSVPWTGPYSGHAPHGDTCLNSSTRGMCHAVLWKRRGASMLDSLGKGAGTKGPAHRRDRDAGRMGLDESMLGNLCGGVWGGPRGGVHSARCGAKEGLPSSPAPT